NPFFTIQFLLALKEETLLGFDPGTLAWVWDVPRIRAKGFTDNVADLMAAKLGRVPAPTQKALGQLACLGNVAETATLTVVHGESEESMHAALWTPSALGWSSARTGPTRSCTTVCRRRLMRSSTKASAPWSISGSAGCSRRRR